MRRSERVASALKVRWIKLPAIVEAVAADMNLNGIFLKTDVTTTPGALMQLEVELPDGPMSVFGAARFVGATQSGAGIGVEFVVIDELARTRWIAFYRQRTAAQDHASNAFSV